MSRFWYVVQKAVKVVAAPLLAAGITAYFEVRTRHTSNEAEAAHGAANTSYEILAPTVRDLQEQVRVLSAQVELLKQFTLLRRGRDLDSLERAPSVGLRPPVPVPNKIPDQRQMAD